MGSWNVLHEAPSLAPPLHSPSLPPCPTLLPLGAAAPGLAERREAAGKRVEGDRRRPSWGSGPAGAQEGNGGAECKQLVGVTKEELEETHIA